MPLPVAGGLDVLEESVRHGFDVSCIPDGVVPATNRDLTDFPGGVGPVRFFKRLNQIMVSLRIHRLIDISQPRITISRRQDFACARIAPLILRAGSTKAFSANG